MAEPGVTRGQAQDFCIGRICFLNDHRRGNASRKFYCPRFVLTKKIRSSAVLHLSLIYLGTRPSYSPCTFTTRGLKKPLWNPKAYHIRQPGRLLKRVGLKCPTIGYQCRTRSVFSRETLPLHDQQRRRLMRWSQRGSNAFRSWIPSFSSFPLEMMAAGVPGLIKLFCSLFAITCCICCLPWICALILRHIGSRGRDVSLRPETLVCTCGWRFR